MEMQGYVQGYRWTRDEDQRPKMVYTCVRPEVNVHFHESHRGMSPRRDDKIEVHRYTKQSHGQGERHV